MLIGASRFAHADLPDLPAVRNNLTALAEILTDPDGTGLPAAHCPVVIDPTDIAVAGGALEGAAEAADDVLIVYYAGHGLVEPRSGELYLTLPGTDPERLRWTGLPFAHVRETLRDARAKVRVLLLDCCFSGRAIQAMADTHSVISGQIDIAGTYTLTASPANTPANAPQGERFTAFSGELISWLRVGDPAAPELLSLSDTYLHLLRTLTSRGLPQPQQHGTRTANWLALVPNPALTQGDSEPAQPTDARHSEIAESGGDIWDVITDEQARSWQREAFNGNVDAVRHLGNLAEKRRRLDEAETWYRRAAETGDTDAMHHLADLHELRADESQETNGALSPERQRYLAVAENWLRMATDADGRVESYQLGRILLKQDRFVEAESCFREVAKSGDANAMRGLAESLAKQDRRGEAEIWYRKSAEAGNEEAMCHLGRLLKERGKIKSATSWYRKAAENDNPTAMAALNQLLEEHPWLR